MAIADLVMCIQPYSGESDLLGDAQVVLVRDNLGNNRTRSLVFVQSVVLGFQGTLPFLRFGSSKVDTLGINAHPPGVGTKPQLSLPMFILKPNCRNRVNDSSKTNIRIVSYQSHGEIYFRDSIGELRKYVRTMHAQVHNISLPPSGIGTSAHIPRS